MGNKFELIADTALREYRMTLECYGYTAADFEVTEELDPPGRKLVSGTPGGFVIVTRKPTGVVRRYRAGPILRWTVAFEDDIKRGAFVGKSHM